MSNIAGWLKDISEYIKFIAPIVGLGGSGVALFETTLGGTRMIDAFAFQNKLKLSNMHHIDQSTLLGWGKQIVLVPVKNISESNSLIILLYLCSFMIVFIALALHLLSRDKGQSEQRLLLIYHKFHSYITILIYMVLLSMIICSPSIVIEFFALLLFISFFLTHMFLCFKDIQHGDKTQKSAWLFSWLSLVILLLLLPSVYGRRFFSPDVHVVEAFDSRHEVVDVIKEQFIRVFFTMPAKHGEYAVGILQHTASDGTRTLKVVKQQIPATEKNSLTTMPVISFKRLLAIEHRPVYTNINVKRLRREVQQGLAGQTVEDTEHGYPLAPY